MAKIKDKDKDPSFEDSLSALEKIVGQLESGELPLEQALEIFEEGIGLARRCQTQLAEAERKVEVLLRERGEIKTVSFDLRSDINSVIPDKKIPIPSAASAESLVSTETEKSLKASTFDDVIPF